MRRILPAILGLAGLLLGSSAPATAQTVLTPSGVRVLVESEGGVIRTVPAAAAGSAADAAAASAASGATRLERLKKLTYDRRPSAILKALSTPEKPVADNAVMADAADRPIEPSIARETAEVPGSVPVVVPEAEAEKAKAAAAAKAKAAAEAAEKAKLDKELATLQRQVTLSLWSDVKSYLAGLPADEGKEGFAQMVRSLSSPAASPSSPEEPRSRSSGVSEQYVFDLDDIVGLVDACPHDLDKPLLTSLAAIVRQALQGGVLIDAVVNRLQAEAAAPAETAVLSKLHCAWLLSSLGQAARLDEFLPTYEQALADKDVEALILWSECRSAEHVADGKPETLELAFNHVLPVLTLEGVKEPDRDRALKLALALAPRVKAELGQAWLDQVLTGDPELGLTVLAATGGTAASSLQRHLQSPSSRQAELQVQKQVVESLLEKAPARADEWQDVLRVLALAWLREAELSRTLDQSTSLGPRMSRDMYGNLFYTGGGMTLDENGVVMSSSGQQNQPRPISSADVLKAAPSEAWLARLDAAVQPKFLTLQAQLLLKVNDEERAFPYIERLAAAHPEPARELAEEFVRVWTRNHDPNANSASRYTSPYMLMYGFDVRAAGIPLTRSKQERNLDELTKWVQKIRALPLDELEETLLARAFTNCHSRAEVYRREAIEQVFGSITELPPETLASLAQQMRTNLSTIWRMPAEQEAAKTQRKQKDIEAEVLRGYTVTRDLLTGATQQHAQDWRLRLALACLQLDEARYRQEVAPSSEFNAQRLAALESFRQAAELYAAACPQLKAHEQTSEPYEHWFYAGLGASDIAQLDQSCTTDPRQPALIRAALQALPGEAAEQHVAKFANALFTRMSGLKPNVKFRYLEAGFEIVADAPEAREARQVFDYYRDLVREVQLVTRLDGSARVGHSAPFGVFVELLHTTEIERESGGFAKYLQNQGSMSYAYNYGRPLENYRDKFESGVRTALEEHFDVLSVTFQEKDVHARAAAEYGWRITPYAYLLLQARGPEVNKLPALKLDLDFLDTTGYVALPAASSPLFLDAALEHGDVRPYDRLQVTQTLDERQAAEGRLVLEVRATSQGLAPDLATLFDVRSSDFDVASTEDEGVAVSKFDAESGESQVLSERSWLIHYTGRRDLQSLPQTFRFPEPKVATHELAYLRYNDADLVPVESEVTLQAQYGEVSSRWPWVVAGAVALLLAGAVLVRSLRRTALVAESGPALPEMLTPFHVLALLRRASQSDGLSPASRSELAGQIALLESHYFSDRNGSAGSPPDLRSVAERWLKPQTTAIPGR